jgi:MarR family transcriptional regulator, 2-MHQ and catechol-resistance regulon repressor
LTPTQFGVLEAILHKGPLSQRELGRKVLTSAGNMTDLIDKLESRGLVRRVRQKLDRRLVRVELTPGGRTLIEPLFIAHAGDIAGVMAALHDEELRELSALLKKLGLSAGIKGENASDEAGPLATAEASH